MDPHSDISDIDIESQISENSINHESLNPFSKIAKDIARSIHRKLEFEIDIPGGSIEIPRASIFQVPETITTTKPEAYKPKQIGFGPHRGPGRTRMEERKLLVVKKIQQYYKINDFKLTVVDKVIQIVPDIRVCYDMLLPDDDDDDASMGNHFATDGIFLLNLLQSYDNTSRRDRLLAQDIMMVENQIPLMVLEEIHDALQHKSSSSGDNKFSPSIFRSFSEIHSPLELCPPSHAPHVRVDHLLDYMYRSILYNDARLHLLDYFLRPILDNEAPAPARTYRRARLAASPFLYLCGSVIAFLDKLPVEKIVQLYEQIITCLQKFSESKNTLASASNLQDRAGFKFCPLPNNEGINNIKINGDCFYLPFITLNDDSEVILRNLVAYEMLDPESNRFPLTEYMSLMCWLVVDVDDVKILRKENVIKGDLGDDEVVKLFGEMSLKTIEESELKGMIDEAIKVYESRPMTRVHLFVKKLVKWLLVILTALGRFVGVMWNIVGFLILIGVVIIATYEAYCEVFGCEQKSATLLGNLIAYFDV